MMRIVQAGCVLVLLAVFLAYLLAPAVTALQRRILLGKRRRPLSRTAVIVLIYLALAGPGVLIWQRSAGAVERWVHVTAPTVVSRVFSADNRAAAVGAIVERLNLSGSVRHRTEAGTLRVSAYVEGEIRRALRDLVTAAEYVRWLAVTPLIAFLLLAYAPGFRRSALRVLPHGHLQWRGEEYLRDVNSALAGYTRAQLAAGALIGAVCAVAFWWFGLPDPVSLGIVAGLLELVPVIGPATVGLMAAGEADQPVAVLVFLIGLRAVQDYVVYPRLIRRGMHLSSVAVILAVWCGAALNGAAGVLLAIPAAGFLSVSARHWREYSDIERLVRAAARERARRVDEIETPPVT